MNKLLPLLLFLFVSNSTSVTANNINTKNSEAIALYQTCPGATGLVVTENISGSVSFAWNNVEDAVDGYNWRVFLTTQNPFTATPIQEGLLPAGSTSLTVENLNGLTQYRLVLISKCSFGDSAPTVSFVVFTTPCSPLLPPTATENFSQATANFNTNANMPCWSEGTGAFVDGHMPNGANGTWLAGNFANNASNPNGLSARVNLWVNGNEWLYSPVINLGDGSETYALEYDVIVTPFSGTAIAPSMGLHTVNVVISTDGGATWFTDDILLTYNNSNIPNASQTPTISLEGYSGNVMIGFHAERVASNDIWFHIDNFRVVEAPSCFRPLFLSITNPGLETAEASWPEVSGALDGYNLEVYEDGDDPEVDEPVYSEIIPFGQTSTLITGLEEDEDYTAYIFANCGEENGVSDVVFKDFSTIFEGVGCGAPILIDELPYTTSDNTSSYLNFYVGQPGTDCGTAGNYLNANDVVYSFVAPQNAAVTINLSNITGNNAAVFVYESCNDIGVNCYAGSANGFNAVPIELFEVPVIEGNEYKIVISSTTTQNVVYQLDVTLITCARPSELDSQIVGVGEIELDWQGNGTETQWEVQYGEQGFAFDSEEATSLIVDEEFVVLNNLPSSTQFSYAVRAICEDDGFSLWSPSLNFRSPIIPVEVAGGEQVFESHCYGNLEFKEWLFVSTASPIESLILFFESGSVVDNQFDSDRFRLFDGFSEDGTLLWDTNLDGKDLSGNTFVASTGAFYMQLTSDIAQSCQGGQPSVGIPDPFDMTITSPTFSTSSFEAFQFSFYPNPVSNVLYLSSLSNIDSVTIYDIRGTKVISELPKNTSHTINTDALQNGIYLMNILIEGKSETYKLIKK